MRFSWGVNIYFLWENNDKIAVMLNYHKLSKDYDILNNNRFLGNIHLSNPCIQLFRKKNLMKIN